MWLMPRLSVDGKHLLLDGERCFLRAVTYGPFPGDCGLDDAIELTRIAQAGFHVVRIYGLPDQKFLDLAAAECLLVIPTHTWGHGCDFFSQPKIFREAEYDLEDWLRRYRNHAALGAILVGNEIPSDMARWMGPSRVRAKIDQLIRTCHRVAPALPAAYANFPTTEYLEPMDGDFTAFNLYLEDVEALKNYLPRLHHLAGDRPVMITEFGLDTQRNSEAAQENLLPKALTLCHEAGLAGSTIYAWSDHWKNNGRTVDDWSFGLTRRDGSAKPVLEKLAAWQPSPAPEQPKFSVIVCSRNGAARLTSCLDSIAALQYENFETLVINDGSTDGTRKLLDQRKDIRAFHLKPNGLSAARNHGASQASGEILAFTDDDCVVDSHWLFELARAYAATDHTAIGGPNLSPPVQTISRALTTAAPGAPTHVMLTDTLAEHLPGCHLSVKKSAFEEIGGFDPIFHTAGDDVDFCWRLRDAGHTLGFRASSFVWHHRRATLWRYLKQQIGYGRAEALLYKKHPHRFGEGGIRWQGVVYQGNALGVQSGDFIYSGPSGQAAYQSLALYRQPERGLPEGYRSNRAKFLLRTLSSLSRALRAFTRQRHGGPGRGTPKETLPPPSAAVEKTLTLTHPWGKGWAEFYHLLQDTNWQPCDESDWDLALGKDRIFAATEQVPEYNRRTFIRFHGSSKTFARVKERARAVGFEMSQNEAPHIYISKTN